MAKRKIKRFLTVYTASESSSDPDWPVGHEVSGSFLSRGDAIKACVDDAIMDINTGWGKARELASRDSRIVEALGKIGMSEDEVGEMFASDRSIPNRAIAAIRAVISDIIGGESCFILRSENGMFEFRYDVDENDVEGEYGLQLWTCITTGKDYLDGDPEWEEAFPEVFMSEKDATKCALDDLKGFLDGYDKDAMRRELEEAAAALEDKGHYEFQVRDQKLRRWDIWSTPLDIGQGSGRIQRIG